MKEGIQVVTPSRSAPWKTMVIIIRTSSIEKGKRRDDDLSGAGRAVLNGLTASTRKHSLFQTSAMTTPTLPQNQNTPRQSAMLMMSGEMRYTRMVPPQEPQEMRTAQRAYSSESNR